MRFPDLLHALSAIAGFAAGGALVVLVIAMQPGPRPAAVALESVRDDGGVAPSRAPAMPEHRVRDEPVDEPADAAASAGRDGGSIDADSLAALVETLRDRELEIPVADIGPDELADDFDDPRSAGRTHEALDILAPRGTPVIAVEDGTIASLDPSQGGGGIVIYQYDPSGEFAYYYAHLEGYADGLEEGDEVERGDVIGYVGTSGNAPPNVPHLHFAIHKTAVGYRWWKGIPINPFSVLR